MSVQVELEFHALRARCPVLRSRRTGCLGGALAAALGSLAGRLGAVALLWWPRRRSGGPASRGLPWRCWPRGAAFVGGALGGRGLCALAGGRPRAAGCPGACLGAVALATPVLLAAGGLRAGAGGLRPDRAFLPGTAVSRRVGGPLVARNAGLRSPARWPCSRAHSRIAGPSLAACRPNGRRPPTSLHIRPPISAGGP